ncbi:MAG: translocation/assembly module TamB domain-containing protein [Pseudomonadota bacterium]
MTKLIYALPLLTLALPAFAQTAQEEEDKGYLIELIEENLSGVSREVRIDGFRGALSSEATLDRMTIADEDGIWLTLEDAILDWNRAALLRGRIEVNELSAAKITVARAPINDGSGQSGPSPEATGFSLPDLPVSIALGELRIDEIALGDSFLGEPVQISLSGTAELAGGDGSANVTARRLDGAAGQFIIDGSYSNATTMLDLNLDISEEADGIAARLLGIPDRPALALKITGEGPIATFGAELAIATDGRDRINGTFSRAPKDGEDGFALNIRGDLTPLLASDYHDFFGEEVMLVAEGRQRADGRYDIPTLDLTARRIRLTGDAIFGSEGWPERIDLIGNIDDPGGDPVLLPLRGPQTRVDDVSLNVAYDQGISDDWTAAFVINGYQRTGLALDQLNLTGGGIIQPGDGADIGAYTADMRFAATGVALDDPGTAQAFGDSLFGTFKASSTEGQPTLIEQFTLRGPGLEADATGLIDTEADSLPITSTVTLRVDALDRFSTLAGRALGGSAATDIVSEIDPLLGLYDIAISGTTEDLKADIAQVDPLLAGTGDIAVRFVRDEDGTRLEEFNIATNEATITADADLTSDGSDARFNARIRDVRVMDASLSGPATIVGTALQTADGDVTFDVDGTGPDIEFTADGTATPQRLGYLVDADVNAALADLGTYADIANRDLAGAANASLKGTINTDTLLFDGSLSAISIDLALDVPEVDPLLAGTGTINGSFARTSDTAFIATDMKLRLPEIRLDADAAYDSAGPIDATFDAQLSNVGLVVDGVSGPFSAKGTAQRGADGVADIDVQASAPGVAADVDVSVAPTTNAISGTIAASIADLGDYADLIDRPVRGAIDATIVGDLVPDLSAFDLVLDIATQGLATGIAQVDPLLTGAGTVAATARRSDEGITVPELMVRTPQMSVDAVLQANNQGQGSGTYTARINDVGLITTGLSGPATAEGVAAQRADGTWDVQSDLTGPGATATADIAIAAGTQEISGSVQAQVNELAAYRRLIGQPLSGGVTADVSGRLLPDLTRFAADVAVQTRDIAIGNATADLLLRGLGSVDLTAERTDAGIKVSNLNARTNNVSVTGTLDTTNAGDSQGRFQARLRDVGILTDQLSGPVTAEGTASVSSEGVIGLNIDGAGPGGITLAADGTVNGTVLDIDARGQVPLGLANAALAPRRITGVAEIDLGINGPPDLTSLSGVVTVAGARLAAPTLNQALNDIGGSVRLANGSAQVELAGSVQTGGRLTITGPVGVTGSLPADLQLDVRNVVLRDPSLYETSIDGEITVRGPLTGGAAVVGRLNVSNTEIQVPSSGVGSLGDLPNVVHIGQDGRIQQTLDRAGVSATPASSSGGASRGGPVYPLDIVINAPSRIFIRGRGLDAELGGQLSISGTSQNIIPVGEFGLIRGRLNILQQRFELTEGTASLQGDFSPYLRLVAETEARTGTIVRIIVEGPADAPEVTFSSSPDLPEDEVLAQLIFGRNLSEISPFQAVQLAAAVGTLAGTGGGGLIDGFRQDLGLDDFDVRTDDDGNAAVRAGAYLSENVYTDVTINAEGETEINLNLDITSEITAKGSVDQDGETSIGIFFERDY